MKSSKKKAKASQKKERSNWISFSAVADESGQIKLDWSGPHFLANGRPVQDATIFSSYARDGKGEKVLSNIDVGDGAISVVDTLARWSPARVVFDHFDTLLAVDTNTKFVNGLWVSTTIALITLPGWNADPQKGKAMVHLHSRFVELNSLKPQDPEGLGWYRVFSSGLSVLRAPYAQNRLGLVVDSKLGEHSEINARSRPYFNDFRLPDGVSLIYASDAANDSIMNALIRQCDKLGSDLLATIENETQPLPKWESGNSYLLVNPSAQAD